MSSADYFERSYIIFSIGEGEERPSRLNSRISRPATATGSSNGIAEAGHGGQNDADAGTGEVASGSKGSGGREMFEDALIESSAEHDKKGPKKALSLPVSIAVPAIVLGGSIGASIWFVAEVPEPPIPVTFYAAAPPPPPRRLRPRPAVRSKAVDPNPFPSCQRDDGADHSGDRSRAPCRRAQVFGEGRWL